MEEVFSNIAIPFIEQQMRFMGFEEWRIEYKIYALDASESKELDYHNQFMYLTYCETQLKVSSDENRRVFDKTNTLVKEHFVEHTGKITILNQSASIRKKIAWIEITPTVKKIKPN